MSFSPLSLIFLTHWSIDSYPVNKEAYVDEFFPFVFNLPDTLEHRYLPVNKEAYVDEFFPLVFNLPDTLEHKFLPGK